MSSDPGSISASGGFSAAAPRSRGTIAPACERISSRCSSHAAPSALSTCGQLGMPCRGSGGKYVPAQNGMPVGVRNAFSGQPPCPVIACTASM